MSNYLNRAILTALLLCGCSTYPPRPYPWNFPPEEEWNAPLEMSWVNFVDTWRRITVPKGKIYDPLMRNYQPYFGKEVRNNGYEKKEKRRR